MSEANGVLRMTAWRDLFPWWLLFRVFRLAISPSILSLATVASLLTPLGWWLAGGLFLPGDLGTSDPEFAALADRLQTVPGGRGTGPVADSPWQTGELLQRPVPVIWSAGTAEARGVYLRLVEPFRRFLRPGQALSRYAYLLLGGLWTLLVWSFFGGAITRIAVVRFGPEQRVGVREALTYARRRLHSYFLAPLFPLLAVLAVVVFSFPLGLLMRLELGVLVAGLLWLLVLLGALIVAVLLFGLLFGWPLMWATISSEESGDVFEATQRCYSYTFDRPLNYALYAALATFLAAAGWIVVWTVSEAVIGLSFWAVSWGAGSEVTQRVLNLALYGQELGGGQDLGGGPVLDSGPEASGIGGVGGWLIGLQCRLVRCIAASYVYAFFWCAASAIYLLLRLDVDQTELDEVFVDDDEDRFGLPPLHMDEQGVPGVADIPETSAASLSGEGPEGGPQPEGHRDSDDPQGTHGTAS